jgi:hypothetical protein
MHTATQISEGTGHTAYTRASVDHISVEPIPEAATYATNHVGSFPFEDDQNIDSALGVQLGKGNPRTDLSRRSCSFGVTDCQF